MASATEGRPGEPLNATEQTAPRRTPSTRTRAKLAGILFALVTTSLMIIGNLHLRADPPLGTPPPELSFDSVTAEPSRTTGSFAALAVAPVNSSFISRMVAGEPPLLFPIEVAEAIGPDVYSFRSSSLTGPTQWFPNPTQFGGPRVFRVLDSTSNPDAIKVSLPLKPNGQVGWVARESVELSTIKHQVLVDLDDDTVTVWDGSNVLSQSEAVTGTQWTPTPPGIFFMRDVIQTGNPGGAYGTHILALSAFSEVLDSFAGGLPAIAIHGTNQPDTMGQERSNGCVRLPNEIIGLLADELPLGTPVTVVRSKSLPGFVSSDEPNPRGGFY